MATSAETTREENAAGAADTTADTENGSDSAAAQDSTSTDSTSSGENGSDGVYIVEEGDCLLYTSFPKEDLKTLRHMGSYLQGHPDMKHIPGVDMSSGSLGQGISAAVGMAIAGKLSNADYRVYTLLGDGELQEGQVWEASMRCV